MVKPYHTSFKPIINLETELTLRRKPPTFTPPGHSTMMEALAAFTHKIGCPALSPPNAYPCLCVLHYDSDGKVWRWY